MRIVNPIEICVFELDDRISIHRFTIVVDAIVIQVFEHPSAYNTCRPVVTEIHGVGNLTRCVQNNVQCLRCCPCPWSQGIPKSPLYLIRTERHGKRKFSVNKILGERHGSSNEKGQPSTNSNLVGVKRAIPILVVINSSGNSRRLVKDRYVVDVPTLEIVIERISRIEYEPDVDCLVGVGREVE